MKKLLEQFVASVLLEQYTEPQEKQKVLLTLRNKAVEMLSTPEVKGMLIVPPTPEQVVYEPPNAYIAFGVQKENVDPKNFDAILKVAVETLGPVAEEMGWFITDTSKNWRSATMLFESNYGSQVPNKKLPPVMYHVTNVKNVENILQNGLVPSRPVAKGEIRTRRYNPRIYLATTDKMAAIVRSQFHQGAIRNPDVIFKKQEPEKFTTLKIDTASLPKDIKFYYDDEMQGAQRKMSVWTYDAIPPQAISTLNA